MRMIHNYPNLEEILPENLVSNHIRTITGKDFQQYHSSCSIDLFFETVHPNNLDENFIVSYFSPDFSSNSSMTYKEASSEIYSRSSHQHDYFELLYVIRGEMYQIIENKRHLYPEGSLCLLNRKIHHIEEFSTDFRTLFLSIPPKLIKGILKDSNSYFFQKEQQQKDSIIERFFNSNLQNESVSIREYIDFIPQKSDPKVNEQMYSFFEQITTSFLFPSIGSTYIIKGLILQIFSALANIDNYQTLPINIGTELKAQIFDQITLLMSKTHGRISRSELEHKLNYNGAYLNKIVKIYTGFTIFDYGMTFCMKEAQNLLVNTELSISDITEMLNFSNRTHFYKIFEETYGVTPRIFRINLKKKESDKTTLQ